MPSFTLCFVVDSIHRKVLLGWKKRGFGVNKWNGFGGKSNPGESIQEAAVRELEEECGLMVSKFDLLDAGTILFQNVSRPESDQLVHLFVAFSWAGHPIETEEMKPRWFSFDELPFDSMWADDRHWLLKVLNGSKVAGQFLFEADDEAIRSFDVKLTGLLEPLKESKHL